MRFGIGWEGIVIAGQVQFLVLTTVSMLAYGGGSTIDPQQHGYNYFHNFFSDLGRTVSVSNAQNATSSLIFPITLSLLGISHMIFYSVFRLENGEAIFKLCRAIGIISSVGVLLTALTPLDVLASAHRIAVSVWIVPFFAVTALYSYYLFINRWPLYLVVMTACLSASVLFHIVQLAIAGGGGHTPATQKFVINFLLIWFSVCAVHHYRTYGGSAEK